MYRRPRFLEILIGIREEMARDADFDVDLFVENLRNGHRPSVHAKKYSMNGDERSKAAAQNEESKSKR